MSKLVNHIIAYDGSQLTPLINDLTHIFTHSHQSRLESSLLFWSDSFEHLPASHFELYFFNQGKLISASSRQLPILKERDIYTYEFSKHDFEDSTLYIVELPHVREDIIFDLAMNYIIHITILLLILLCLVFVVLSKYLSPLTQFSFDIRDKNENDLSPIPDQATTAELHQLQHSINNLIFRLRKSLDREKEFTNMAAHELKTPLAIIRLSAENARKNDHVNSRKKDLDDAISGVDRANSIIKELFNLTKLDQTLYLNFEKVSVCNILNSIIDEFKPLLQARSQIFVHPINDAQVYADRSLITILFDNLISNAIKYSGEGSTITFNIRDCGMSACIVVSDSGKSIPDVTRERIFERFYRGQNVEPGTGLGLSIASNIAHLHGTKITLLPRNDDLNSFCFVLRKVV
ncbi:sensor histidine kinase [Vibrio orientalis]|nr:HAMP domain-containing sensor histidine kinase [Vibrio orientalis]